MGHSSRIFWASTSGTTQTTPDQTRKLESPFHGPFMGCRKFGCASPTFTAATVPANVAWLLGKLWSLVHFEESIAEEVLLRSSDSGELGGSAQQTQEEHPALSGNLAGCGCEGYEAFCGIELEAVWLGLLGSSRRFEGASQRKLMND